MESHQRCAAEIISGIIRGSKHWEYEKTIELWTNLIPLIETAIVNIYAETKTDWAICFSMALESRDPSRCYWLLEHLMEDPLQDPTSFTACERLRLLSTALAQQTWRNKELCLRLLDYVKPHLTHRFQNIREKISFCLTLVLREDTILQLGNTTGSRKTLDFLGEVFPVLHNLYVQALAKLENSNGRAVSEGDKMDCDNAGDETTTDNEETQSSIRLFKVGESVFETPLKNLFRFAWRN